MLMKGLNCENVVSLRSVLRSPQHICLVLECLSGGSLIDLLMGSGRLDEKQTRSYFRQLISGVEYCHSRGVFHRDLKPDNILLSSDMLTVKVADFGLATLVSENTKDRRKSKCGSTPYAAPELFNAEIAPYLPGPADIWGCGLLLYIMAAGFPPFNAASSFDLLVEKICSANVKYPAWFSADLKDLLRKILKADPSARLTLTEIKEHPWFTETSFSVKHVSTPSLRLSTPRSVLTNSSSIGDASPIPFSLSHSPEKSTERSALSTSANFSSENELNKSNTSLKSMDSSTDSILRASGAVSNSSSSHSLTGSGVLHLTNPGIDDDLVPPCIIPIANAFSLIYFSGAFDLTRILEGPCLKPFTLSLSTKFVWHDMTVTDAFHSLVEILSSLNLSVKKMEMSGTLTVHGWSLDDPSPCSFVIQLYTLLPEAPLVEFSFLGGSEMAYLLLYKQICCKAVGLGLQVKEFEESEVNDI